jgi:DNA-binding Lrp family transcriptional regulator
MENRNIKNIERRIKEIAKDYESRGFTVIINPRQSELPQFLKGFEPDIIARSKNESVVIEVKSKGHINELKRFEELAEKISQKKNWRFELVFTNPQEQPIRTSSEKTLNLNKIKQRLNEIEILKSTSQYAAAFLLGWATLEAAIRLKLQSEKSDSLNKATLSIIKTLFSLGLINQHDYRKLEKLNNTRNYLIHGFDQKIDRASVDELLSILNYLIGESKESQMHDWLDGLDLDGYEEIYSLYRAVADKEDFGIFKYEETDNKIILSAPHIDDKLELDNDEERKQFEDLIEAEYMDDMDAESWYGFKRAMDKDD